MKKRFLKLNIVFFIIIVNIMTSFGAKKPNIDTGEVKEPSAEPKSYTSEGVIISEEKIDTIDPLHATPSYMEKDEYKEVDNFIIDIKTIPNRIKYFSPTYLNYRTTAENTVKMSLYGAGGSDYNNLLVKNTLKTLPSQKRDLNNTLKELNTTLDFLISHGITSGPQYEAVVNGIEEVSVGIATIDATSVSLSQAALGYGSAVRMINNIDNNSSMQMLNNTLSKSLINAFLSYKELEFYETILDKQVLLYTDMLSLYHKNYLLGINTSEEVRQYLINLENAKKTRHNIKATKKNVKEMIAINLGYERKDFDKLVFVEPEIDATYLFETSASSHYEQAYNSNSAYNTIRTSGRSDKKLPGTTGEELKNKRLEATKEKIINKLDSLYDILHISVYTYNATEYLNEVVKLNDEANLRKLQNNLVSNLEYRGLEIQNDANKMKVKTAKYDLIKNSVNYHYAILGIMDIE